jgi:hypothetical protein
LYGAFFVKEFAERKIFCHSSVSLFDLKEPFLRPDPGSLTSSRAGVVKVGRRAKLAAYSELARSYLDSFEHDGIAWCDRETIRGEPAFGRADQPRRNLVSGGSKNPNHDAVIRIGQRMSFGHSAVATLCRHHRKHDLKLFKVRDFAPDFAQLLRQRFD